MMGAHDEKRRAAEAFAQRLLTSSVADSIAKIVLFGSVLKGEAQPDSDVDLLVIATDALDRVTEACLDGAFEINVESGQSVEPLIYCLDARRFPGSYFVYRALQTGEEIYSMDEQKLRREESRAYLELAEEYVHGARNSLACGDYRLAIDGAYSAAELCAKGLLLLKLEDLPTSHGGVVGKFGELYIRTGTLPQELGRELNRSLWLRNQARYERHTTIGQKEAQTMLELANKLIIALTEALKSEKE